MTEITLEFDIDPAPKLRPRFTKAGFAYTPAKTRAFEKSLQTLARFKFRQVAMDGPLSVLIDFHIKRPRSVKRPHHTVKPDLDNLQKAVLDSLNKIVWIDDAQIVDLIGRKFYSDHPKIIVTVRSVVKTWD